MGGLDSDGRRRAKSSRISNALETKSRSIRMKKPRRGGAAAGREGGSDQRSRGSQSAMWVMPSSAGVSSLTRRARTQLVPNSGAPILRLM